MIIKNFEIDKFKKSNLNLHLIYGVNDGIKQDLISNIYLKGFEGDILKYDEHEDSFDDHPFYNTQCAFWVVCLPSNQTS